MFWLAASFCLTVARIPASGASISQSEAASPVPEVAAAWVKIEPSVVILRRGNSERGTAALIDSQGYFITGNSAVEGATSLEGKFFDGRTITLFPVAIDPPTQLVLLRSYDPLGDSKPVSLYQPKDEAVDADHPKSVIAALMTGPLSAELVSTKTLALLRSARAVSLLSEIHFEGPALRVGGAPIFTSDGQLVGILQAALPQAEHFVRNFVDESNVGGGGGIGGALSLSQKTYGPGGQTVAYSPAPTVMQRVIRGLMAPKHEPLRPAIGVLCRSAPNGGAYVDAVDDNSPAAAAGIREGDVILIIEGILIHSQVEFARVMLQQTVGSDITVTVRREGKLMNFRVRVGM